jgi:peroxiredoxin family protein
MHLSQAPSMPIPALMGAIPGMTKMATFTMRRQIADQGIPPVPGLLDEIVSANGHLWVCRMSVDMRDLVAAQLYDGVKDVISATNFIEIAEGAQIISV